MAGGFEINEKALGLGVSLNNTGKNDQTISHESRTLGDQEIYDLLRLSITPRRIPPISAPGIEPIPPNTAATNALIPGIEPV